MKRSATRSLVTFTIDAKLTATKQRQTLAAVKQLWIHLGFEPRVHDLHWQRLDDFAQWMLAKHSAGTTTNLYLKLLAQLARKAADAGLIPLLGKRPRVKNTPAVKPEPKPAFTPPEVSAPVVVPRPRPLPKEKPKTAIDFYERWYEPRVLVQASAHYKWRCRKVLALLGEFLGRPATVDDLTDDNIADYLGSVIARGRTASTANTHRKTLIALANFAARKGFCAFPDVPKLTELRRAPTSWSVEQVEAILTACRRQVGMVGEVPAGIFWPALVLVLFDTGTRIGALLRTPLECLDLSAGVLTIPAEVQKTKMDQRFVLHPDTLAALRRITAPRVLLFPWHRSSASLQDHYRRILQQANLPHGARDKFHRLRRTSATLCELAAGNGSASLHLGHSDKAVTQLYLDTTVIPARRIAELLPRPFVPSNETIEGTLATIGGDQ